MTCKHQSDKAYQQIRKCLIERRLNPGTRLKEAHWAEKIGVNRGDIRQALARLGADGLLVKGEKGGFFVRRYTEKDLKEINETRILLEKGAAELAVNKATNKDIQELKSICSHIVSMAENKYEQGFDEADLRFHTVLVRAAHNEKILQVYKRANIMLSSSGGMGKADSLKNDLLKTAEDHRQIVEALKNKDLKKMISLLKKGLV